MVQWDYDTGTTFYWGFTCISVVVVVRTKLLRIMNRSVHTRAIVPDVPIFIGGYLSCLAKNTVGAIFHQ